MGATGANPAFSSTISALTTFGSGLNFTQNNASGSGIAVVTTNMVHFEEGTWTPLLGAATPNGFAVTYTSQAGWYQRIGANVIIDLDLEWSSYTNTPPSGAMQITGVPFAMDTNYAGNIACTFGATGFSLDAGYTTVALQVGSSTIISVIESGSAKAVSSLAITGQTGGKIRATFRYRTTATV